MTAAQDYAHAMQKGALGLMAEWLTGVDENGAPSLYAPAAPR